MSDAMTEFVRAHAGQLQQRLREERRFIQVVAGPRQSGKTTLVRQVAATAGAPYRYASADEPTLRERNWIAEHWEATRLVATEAARGGALLVLDEIQKIPGWSETVKRLWDEDTRSTRALSIFTQYPE